MPFVRSAAPSQCRALDDLRAALGRRWYRRMTPASSSKLVFRSSLKKTLEAHRVANRTAVVRPVYDHNSPSRGVYRPPLNYTDESAAEALAEPSNSQSTSAANSPQSRKPRISEKQTPKLPRRVSLSTKGDRRDAQQPWLDLAPRPHQHGSGMSRLDAELAALAEYLAPSPSEDAAVARIVHQISDQVSGVVPNSPQLVGSRATRTAFSSSGIDLMVRIGDDGSLSTARRRILNPMAPQASKHFAKAIHNIQAALRQSPEYAEHRVLPGKSPTLVMVHKASSLPIYIFCRNQVPRPDDYIRDSLATISSLRPLYMVLRALLESRNLFGWEAASVGSYGLILLIAAFVRQQNTEFQHKSLGEQLLAMLDTYGSKVDLQTIGVAAEPAGFFDPASIRRHHHETQSLDPVLVGQRALLRFKANARKRSNLPAARHLCIQDPTNYLQDVGLQCVRTAELQKTLSSACNGLHLAMKEWDGATTTGRSSCGSGSILGEVLRANFDKLSRIRASLSV